MSVPTHGPSCETKTYETRCWECEEIAFFFSCTCESRVLFHDRGPPWRKHLCWPEEVVKQVREGFTRKEALLNVSYLMLRAGRQVPEALSSEWIARSKIESALKRSSKTTLYREVKPDEPRDFPGMVMAVDRNINMTKRFKLPPNKRARQLLGKLGRGRWHLLHLREHGADGLGIVAEMFCYMSATDMSRAGIKITQRVLVSVTPYAPPAMEPVWLVTEATIIG